MPHPSTATTSSSSSPFSSSASTTTSSSSSAAARGEGSIFSRTSSLFHRSKSTRGQPPASLAVSAPLPPPPRPSSQQRARKSVSGAREGSPPSHRRSRHSISHSVTDFGANLRRSVSLRSATAQSPSTTLVPSPAITSPTGTSDGSLSSHTLNNASKSTLSLSSLTRRKKSIDSLRSFKISPPPSAPLGGTFPPFEKSGLAMSSSLTAVQFRQVSQRQASGASQSNVGFGDSKGSSSSMAGSAPAVPALPTGAAAGLQNPNVTWSNIQDTAAKRINTLDYLRKAHEGRIYWFNTLLFAPNDLRRLPSFQPPRLARRATNYLLLGFSLPQILDLNSQTPLEFLRALNALLAEFETYQSLHPVDGSSGSGSLSRARIPSMFKRGMQAATSNKNRRASSAADIGFPPPGGSGAVSAVDIPEPGSAVSTMPPMAFPLPSAGLMMGGGGTTTSIPPADAAYGGGGTDTHLPSESYSLLVTPSLPFDPDFAETFATLCDVLIDVYRGVVELVNVPDKVAPGVGELFTKADAKVRKILVAGIVREFEDVARAGVKQEVGGIGRVVLGGLM